MRRLLEDETLGLEEATNKVWGNKPPNTYVRGSDPIDYVLHTNDIEVQLLRMNSFAESVGDHRTVILDVTTQSMIGEYEYKIVRPQSRRLTTQQPSSNGELQDQVRGTDGPPQS